MQYKTWFVFTSKYSFNLISISFQKSITVDLQYDPKSFTNQQWIWYLSLNSFKTSQDAPMTAPRRLKTFPKMCQEDRKTIPRRPKTPERRPRTPQDAPRLLQDGPRRPQDASKTRPRRSKTSKDASKAPQDTSKDAPRRSKAASRSPPMFPALKFTENQYVIRSLVNNCS